MHGISSEQALTAALVGSSCASNGLWVQLFGNVDWAPSDLVTAFLLAGAAQNVRRRVQVAAIVAAGGPGSAPSESRGSPGPPSMPCLALSLGSKDTSLPHFSS